jgi:hypothetical protein
MKHLLLLSFALLSMLGLKAAPGDTTWVQAHSGLQLDYYNNFDTTIKFPDGTTKYRKIIMVFTMGKYVCPAGSSWCGDWDYTVQTFAMNKRGDSLELGRIITPYANVSYARFPWTWKQRYYFDVTDYYPVLKDSNTIRILYSGYSGGFTADVKFAMIEGTPDRDVTGVKHLWHGSYSFGNASDPIDNHVAATSLTAPSGTQSAAYKLNITGHGSDATGCSEFCSKYYQVLKDGILVNQKDIWRDNCGFNNLYPQSGTWVYNRGNWCPGALVNTNLHPLPGISGGTNFNLAMHFENYTTASPSAIYTVDGTVVYYAGFNKTLDASIEDIIAPTDNENSFRQNARIGLTTIKIKNTGSTTINNIDFQYGVTGQPLTSYTWSGTLAALADTTIDLPFAASLLSATGTGLPYEVNIIKVNGATDNDATNNKLTSTFNAAPQWANNFVVTFKTNASLNGSVSETEWNIYDKYGTAVAQRVNNAANTIYRDTITLPNNEVYKFVVTDAGCDGLSFWANTAGGSGSLQIKPTPFTTTSLSGYFNGDFGCGFTQYFKVGTPTSIADIQGLGAMSMDVYPNPTSKDATVSINGLANVKGLLRLYDNMGKMVFEKKVNNPEEKIASSNLANGIYYVIYTPEQSNAKSMQAKLVIIK